MRSRVQPCDHSLQLGRVEGGAPNCRGSRTRPDVEEDAGGAAPHGRRRIVADDRAEAILPNLSHVLGALPIHSRYRAAVDGGVVMHRRRIIDALTVRRQLQVGKPNPAHRIRRRESERGIDGKDAGGRAAVALFFVRLARAAQSVETDSPGEAGFSYDDWNDFADAVPL